MASGGSSRSPSRYPRERRRRERDRAGPHAFGVRLQRQRIGHAEAHSRSVEPLPRRLPNVGQVLRYRKACVSLFQEVRANQLAERRMHLFTSGSSVSRW